jgi:CDP-glycerol glycerophosphotransferase (TagB/SpsB family)
MRTFLPVQWFMGLLSVVTPLFATTNRREIVLTSFHGDGYRGNTKVLFEALCDHPEFEPVWLSRNKSLVADLQSRFGSRRACKAHSFRGLQKLAGAGAVLFTHGTSDFPFLRLPRQSIRIQTYHGLPTKRGEYMRPEHDRPPGFFHQKILEYRFRPIDRFLSSSPMVTDLFSRRFGMSSARFIETGYPSYDSLIHRETEPGLIRETWPEAPPADHLVLYSPTFRKKTATRWLPFEDWDLREVAQFLDDHKLLLLMRPHPNESFDVSEYQSVSPRFVDASQHKIEDIYRLLPLTDAIITDYSSIYLEGLLRDIPPVFIPYDLHEYERGLPLPYDEITPGEQVSTQKEFLEALKEAVQNPDKGRAARDRVRDIYFSDTEGKATERVIRFLEDQLLS